VPPSNETRRRCRSKTGTVSELREFVTGLDRAVKDPLERERSGHTEGEQPRAESERF
jgi:hypothetical protein